MLDRETLEKLINTAREALSRAHAPISQFPVGAAVFTGKGNIFPGCNIETIIPALGVCAERSAIDHAIIHGEIEFTAIAVVNTRPAALFPCGACLQYMHEFAQRTGCDIIVYAQGSNGHTESFPLSRLYPVSFGPNDL